MKAKAKTIPQWVLPLRSAAVILLFQLANDLIRFQDVNLFISSLPFILGTAMLWAAVEYARLYKVDLSHFKHKPKIKSKTGATTFILPVIT
jgi:hypothetical protein